MNNSTIAFKSGTIEWSDDTKSEIEPAILNYDKKIINIVTKQSSKFPIYTIRLVFTDDLVFSGEFTAEEGHDFPNINNRGKVSLDYYRNEVEHILVGKWYDKYGPLFCFIKLRE